MPRVFVHHDKNGKIISIASIETMHDRMAHPFWLDNSDHGVIETTSDDPALAGGLLQAHENARVDVAAKRLILPAPAGTPDAQPTGGRGKKRFVG
jgi:hypothetical protein